MTPKQHELATLLRPSIEALGVELWAIEMMGKAPRITLRIVLDHPDRLVTVEDCAAVSRQVSRVLDVDDPLPDRYTLEVSSPGWERSLYELWHFERFVGHKARVKLKLPFEGRKQFTGMIARLEDQSVVVHVGEDEFVFPFEHIERGQLIVDDGKSVNGTKRHGNGK